MYFYSFKASASPHLCPCYVLPSLKDVWNDCFSLFWVRLKVLLVPDMCEVPCDKLISHHKYKQTDKFCIEKTCDDVEREIDEDFHKVVWTRDVLK